MMKGQPRYFVSLPQTRHSGLNRIDEGASAPVVNLPSAPPRLNDSSSRENSGSSSWRRTPSTSPWNSRQPDAAQSPHELDTVSRSPPPEAPSSESRMPSLAKDDRVESPSISGVSVKMRSQPKMPAGSDVAFYRDTRVNSAVQPTPSVKFIVTSELEGDVSSESNRESVSLPISPLNGALDAPHPSSSGPKITGPSTSISTEKDEPGRSTQPFGQRPATPLQSAGTPWMKSPRAFSNKDFAPDPEHLKAVWSQASDKAELPSTNSLEGIADDLTAVPFTLQDVKSEDGETPPPSVSGPSSRMNSYDVTRAFQQVPSSSSSSSSRAPIPLGSPTNGSVPRHSAFSFSPPMSNANLRPAYPAYGSPLLSPSPSVMYPMQASPIPRPMVLNGGSPAYAQQVWVPVPGPAPPTPGGMMRPLGSPYPQMVPYPSAGGTMPMYGPPPPNMHTGPSQQSNGMQGRSSGMPVMSPVMQQTHPMYGGSPVLMSNLAAGQTYPGAMQPMRAQMRGGFDHAPGMSLMPPSMGHPPPTGGYAPVPSNSFPRPTW
ncbi:hypothetical protein A0H81_00512 [Grifola frondosa]|uniref:Uncharacterized protein n=1 Tax=Grifola frondosa TaxID=5627 RepID=A0A1C7MRA4_GRIFR|nr:hypothetical protein A0H81_00512 [Grifola frondosa]